MEIKNKTILLVEDEHITAIMGRKVLENHGFEVIHAATGEDAVKNIDTNPDIDLILMDIDLGDGIDGTEAAAQILARHDLPLVFLSSHTEPEMVNKTKSITNYGYILKNTGEVVLIASIEMAFKLFDAKKAVSIELEYRKKAEEQLMLQSEMLDIAPESITVHDFDGNLLYANKRTVELHGFDYDELIKINLRDIEVPESRDLIEPRIRQIEESGDATFEVEHFRKDGSVFPLEVHAKKIVWQGIRAILSITTDISDRKLIEQTLRESEENFRHLFESSPEGILVVRGDTIEFANPALERIVGHPLGKLTSQPFITFAHPDDRDILIDRHRSRMKGEAVETGYEFRAITSDGTEKWVSINSQIIDWEGTLANLSFVTDINDRKKAEDALRESEALFRRIFDDHSAVMLLINPNTGRIINANQSAVKYYGYPPAKILQMKIQQLNTLSPQEISKHMHKASTKQSNIFEFRHMLADGLVRDVEVHSTPITIQNQTLLFSIIHDTTERKQAEERLRIITDNMFDLVALTDLKGNYKYITNPYKSIGYNPDFLIGKNAFEFIHPDDIQWLIETLKESIDKEIDNRKFEYRFRKSDGSYIWLETAGKFIKDGNGTITEIIFSSRDINERKQAEQKLFLGLHESDLLREKSEKLLLEKEIILKEAHHRIKNNMNTIFGILLLEAENHDNNCSGILYDASGRVKSMMMLYEKLYQSETHIELNINDYLKPLIDQIIEIHSLNIPVKTNIKFDDIVLSPQILSPLGIIINELTTNSIKHAFAGKKQGIINIIATREINLVTLSYSDNGKGLPEYFSMEESDTFGMQLVDMLVKQIKGTLRIDKGDGVRFEIEFSL